jgi:large conductance mechanosensitive channel
MSFIQEFKDFAVKGNVVDLAVGVIIGAAFGKIVSSLVGDIVMPFLGMIIGGVNFTDLKLKIGAPIEGMQQATINYGAFIQSVFDFTIVALAIFIVIKQLNKLKKPTVPATAIPAKPADIALLEEIRDLLRK